MILKNRKLLYIAPYSIKSFGAEEQDLDAGLNILREDTKKLVYSIKVDLNRKKLIYDVDLKTMSYPANISRIIRYVFNFYTSPDNALRQAYTLKNFLIISEIVAKLNIDTVITNTTSTLLFGKFPNIEHFHRSVCFEPIYALKTVRNPVKAYFHAFIKIFTVIKEVRVNKLLVISPRDKRYYSKFSLLHHSKLTIDVLPLRQFYYAKKQRRMRITKNLNLGFMGSTYNVLHNSRSLKYLLDILDENFLRENNFKFNIYGRKIPSLYLEKYSNTRVKFCNWVNDINSIYKSNQIFLVPNFLNSGMQSKVFEPLIYGRVLVCPTEVLSGFDFEPYRHYVPVNTTQGFDKSLIWIRNNLHQLITISSNASIHAEKLYGRAKIKAVIL